MRNVATKLASAIGAMALVAGTAAAQTVGFSGYTNGTFNAVATPNTNSFQTATAGGLTYENSTFSGATTGGFASIGNNANGLGSIELDNLGAFYLMNNPFTYTGSSFNLRVVFTAPGASNQAFAAALTGAVTVDGAGGVFINFDNAPQTFAYSGVNGSGTVSLSVNDLSINAPSQGELRIGVVSGNLTATATSTVPEPSTYMLLASGMGALGLIARRRRNNV